MEFPGLGTLPVLGFLALLQFIEDHYGLQSISKSMFQLCVYPENHLASGFHNEQAYKSHCVMDFSSDFYSRGFCKGGARV